MEELFKSAENVSRTIQLILAPVVMITACAIMLTGLLSRFAAINDRLRTMTHERFDLLNKPSTEALVVARIRQLDNQIPDLQRRLKIAHNAVLTAYVAILVFIGDMLLIAMAALSGVVWAAFLSLLVFLVGTGVLGLAIVHTIREIRTALKAVLYEVKEVTALMHEMK